MSHTTTRRLIYVLFALSGFAGLIYESIWSHYLKLFLGHAAYAQSLVLAIFMGGMAIGSWLVARRTESISNLLLAYAIVEAILACAGLFFHTGYELWMDIAYNSIIPLLSQSPDSIALVQAFKWTSAALLILPQTILLGMTFPLIAGALVRISGEKPGHTIAVLYFTNSLGASLGVLTSGFLLIDWIGLPGTTMTAGFINGLLAVSVFLISRHSATHTGSHSLVSASGTSNVIQSPRLLLMVAALTGTASFIYEIVWVRMLSIVLGSSSHAFELMLSAFIMGLALGGFWVRRKVDSVDNLPRLLGRVQIAMGICALGSLIAYNYSFEAMAWIFHSVDKTDAGYRLFNLYSQGIAFGVMLPATFCAGMTLPLISSALFKGGWGERSLGQVYTFNTLGSIIGVFAAVHLLLPFLGMKGAIILGAGIDLALGAALLLRNPKASLRADRLYSAVALACLLAAVLAPEISVGKIVSSVMRTGTADISDSGTATFHRDGKTASITVFNRNGKSMSLYTNGKGAASVQLQEGGKLSQDESTMTQLGALPLAAHSNPERIAVIGYGVGMAPHVMLADERVQQVDVIEIEEQIVAGAAKFAPRFQRTVQDPRSTIYIEDARTFFALSDRQYDIIVSAPSNLWVSGVSSLFTRQFYQLVSRNLAQGGILAQWFHIYEIDVPLSATIFKAVASEFSHYNLYGMNNGDVLVIASNSDIPSLDLERLLAPSEVGNQLFRVDVRSTSDMYLRWLGNRTLLQPLFESYTTPANDDYYPTLDLGASRTRFLGKNARELLTIPVAELPIQEMLAPNPYSLNAGTITNSSLLTTGAGAPVLDRLLSRARGKNTNATPAFNTNEIKKLQRSVDKKLAFVGKCEASVVPTLWQRELVQLSSMMERVLSGPEQKIIWNWLITDECRATLSQENRRWLSLVNANVERNAQQMRKLAVEILATLKPEAAPTAPRNISLEYALGSALLGNLALDDARSAANLWQQYGAIATSEEGIPFYLRLLAALTKNDSAQ